MKKVIKKIYKKMTGGLYKVSAVKKAKIDYRLATGKKLNLKNPQNLNEKLQWLNLYTYDERKVKCADKYFAREYIIKHGLEEYLPKLIGVYENVDDIDFEKLPEKFALKCTHGAGFNIICKNKSILDIEKSKKDLNKWLHTDFGISAGEMHYSKMKPRIICEEFLDGLDNDVPIDYKFFCFNGVPRFLEVCTGRFKALKFSFYDMDWNFLDYQSKKYKGKSEFIGKPKSFDKMKEIAKSLSNGFNFVRVDLFDIKGKPYIGEMTFTPHAGRITSMSDEALKKTGDMLMI